LLYNFAVFLAPEEPRAAVPLLRECLDSGAAMDEVGLPAELVLQILVQLGERGDLFEEVAGHLEELDGVGLGVEPWSVANQRAILLSRTGRHDAALAAFAKIFERWPGSSVDVRFNYGMALTRLGRWEDARAEFEQVDYPVAHYGLALTYENTGKIQEAVREHQRFVDEMAVLPYEPLLLRVPELVPGWLERSKEFIAAHSRGNGARSTPHDGSEST
jgi:tetratricopeptide (TPR) repeat protein